MKIKVLGGHGGMAKGFLTTSFLIDDRLLIDAGAVAGTLTIDEQARIQHILISHCHLDHIKDLAFISDNCFGLKDSPFMVYTHGTVKKIIKTHLLNDIVWPDFTQLPSKERPTITINSIDEEVLTKIGDYRVYPVKVNHALDALGFIVEKGDVAVIFTSDTGPTSRIWEVANKYKNLKAIFTEVSFPNSLEEVAMVSQHHTPHSIGVELKKMPENVPVILTHVKPNYRSDISREIRELHEKRFHLLERDGEVFDF